MILCEKFNVGISDISVDGMLSDKGILKYFETIACNHSDIAGFGVNDIPKTKLSWVLLNWRVKVNVRPKYGQEVTVKTWARNVSRAFTMRDFVMLDDGGNVLVIASTKWALIDIEKGLAKITPEIIEKYQVEDGHVFDDGEIFRLSENLSGGVGLSYRVLRRDIDLNNHVHNLFYLDFAKEVLGSDYMFKNFDNIEIAYKKGAILGDVLDIYYAFENDYHLITIKNQQSGATNCIIKLS